ncbi:MAG TPA: hypothetical protein VFL65_00885 [Jatrophihabitans sp.]|nr:hypothetical protein [Jatrophihabitans sp.]
MSVLANVVPDGDDWIPRKLRDLERQIGELRSARTLQSLATSAVYPVVANRETSGSPLFGYAYADYSVVTLPLPAGYTKALILAVATVSIRGTSSGGGSFTVQARVGGELSAGVSGQSAVSGLASATSSLAWSGNIADELVDGKLTCAVRANVQNPDVLNFGLAELAISALFLR